MVLMPDPDSAVLDPFTDETTLNLRCNVLDPLTMTGYERCARSLAARAIAYMQSTGIAEDVLFGPEPEFFVFDSVTWEDRMEGTSYRIRSEEAHWSQGLELEDGNMGHRPGVKGGYFPVPPVDSLADPARGDVPGDGGDGAHRRGPSPRGRKPPVSARSAPSSRASSARADELQILKYCVLNVAHAYGKTATFMPKPLVGDNGSGMHCHQSLVKGGKNLFFGDKYAGLSQEALWYIGGHLQACARAERVHQRRHQQLQASGEGVRGADPARILGTQTAPLRCGFRTAAPPGAASKCVSPTPAATPT